MARKLEVEIVGDASSLKRALGQANSGFKGSIGQWVKGGLVLGGTQKAMELLTGAVKGGISEWQESQKVTAQTNTVLKSTGGVAKVSAKHVDTLATSIMKKSGIDDEAVASGENLLLTFTNVRNEVGKGNKIFDRATVLAADMSTALGQDLKSSNIQLGKALNDPVKGITALSRVGVSFTKGQKDQIKALSDSGDKLGAQKIILKELNKEFGGSAKAAGQTLPGQIKIAKESFSNFSGELVGKTIPILKQAIEWLKDHWPEIKAAIKEMWASVKPVLQQFGDFVGVVVGLIKKHWGTIKPVLMTVVEIVKTAMRQIRNVIKLVTDLLKGDWSAVWQDIKNIVKTAFDQIRNLLTLARQTLGAALLKLAGWLKDKLIEGLKALPDAVWESVKFLGKQIVRGIKAGIELEWQLLKTALAALFHKAVDVVKDVLGIKSPSSVFHDIGVNMIKGMVNGVGSMGGYLKKAVLGLVAKIPHPHFGFAGGASWQSGLVDQVRNAVIYAQSQGWQGTVTSGFRSFAEQSRLYQRYLHGGPLAAAPGHSSHESGQAVDVTDYSTFARIMARAPAGQRLYNHLGARDPVHFSVSGYAKGGIFNRPTLGVIGEAGPEAVVPLGRGRGRPMQVNLQLDGRTLAALLVDPLRGEVQQLRRAGGRF